MDLIEIVEKDMGEWRPLMLTSKTFDSFPSKIDKYIITIKKSY